MTKKELDSLVADMKKANVVTKATAWMVEGMGDKAVESRYVGIKFPDDWGEIMSSANNLLLKFTHTRGDSRVEFYIANKSPFFKFWTQKLAPNTKWEYVLGEMKRKLKKDKEEVTHHNERVGNLYQLILVHLK